jgi:hypothetical protein
MITPEQLLWACALHVEREHGDRAKAFVAERVRVLALAGDMAGVERWLAIAVRLNQICSGAERPQ